MRIRYSILLYLLTPLALLYLAFRGIKDPGYRQRWYERFGWFAPLSGARPIWLHAVSVGEVLAAVPLVRALQARYPEVPLLITTTTPTGSERVRAVFGDSVHHVYAPYDVPGVVGRFLRRIRPRLVVVMETELWPNLFHALHQAHVPLLLANARLSPRSVRQYRRLGRLTRTAIDSIDTIAAQSPLDADRYAALGATALQLIVTGNIKFDLALAEDLPQLGQALRAELGSARPIWVAGSTHEGEDEQVLAAHRQLLERWPELLLILVPRHPERFERVAALCQEQGFRLARRSRAEAGVGAQVYLCDTMGELMRMYAAADVAFVGGSLVPIGGHNVLEPAALGLVPVSGSQLFNFQQIAEVLAAADALILVEDSTALAAQIDRLLANPATRQAAGAHARQIVEMNRGAVAHTLELIEARLSAAALKPLP